MANSAPTAQQQLQAKQAQNLQIRKILIQSCQDAWQQIFQQTFTGGPGTVINIPLRNVGLVKRLIVETAATISAASSTQQLTTLGSSTFYSQVVLTDLNNQTRINTTSWHLTAVASAKARLPYGSAITSTDTPFGYGANYKKTQTAPVSISGAVASNNLYFMMEVPISYSDNDLRGAIYANVVNATFQLQLVVNPNFFAASGAADPIFAGYQSTGATLGTMPSFTVTVYQNYLDQIPISKNGPLLPFYDISCAYLFNVTQFSGLVQGQDNPYPYSNFRDYMSTTVVYDNVGVLTPNGTDISYFAISTANYTNLVKYDVNIAALFARLRLQSDFPTGMYYIDSRQKPISTIQYGNISLLINYATVTSASAYIMMGLESIAVQNQVVQAGSIAGS